MSGELLKRKRNTLRVTGAEELREHQPMIANCCWECGRSSVKQNADVPVGRPPVKPLLILTNPRRAGPGGPARTRGSAPLSGREAHSHWMGNSCELFVTQCPQRIQPGGSACRDIACNRAHHQQRQRNKNVHRGGRYAESGKARGEHRCCHRGERSTDRDTNSGENEAAALD